MIIEIEDGDGGEGHDSPAKGIKPTEEALFEALRELLAGDPLARVTDLTEAARAKLGTTRINRNQVATMLKRSSLQAGRTDLRLRRRAVQLGVPFEALKAAVATGGGACYECKQICMAEEMSGMGGGRCKPCQRAYQLCYRAKKRREG